MILAARTDASWYKVWSKRQEPGELMYSNTSKVQQHTWVDLDIMVESDRLIDFKST